MVMYALGGTVAFYVGSSTATTQTLEVAHQALLLAKPYLQPLFIILKAAQ